MNGPDDYEADLFDAPEEESQRTTKSPSGSGNFHFLLRAADLNCKKKPSNQLTPGEIAFDMAVFFLAAEVPIILWGAPGMGKTSMIHALGKIKDPSGVPLQVVVLVASYQDPSTINGMYYVAKFHDSYEMRLADSEVVNAVTNYRGLSILLLDEINTSQTDTQNVLLRALAERVIGNTNLSDKMAIIGCANPPHTTDYSTEDLAGAILNRCGHIRWNVGPQEFSRGMAGGWGLEPTTSRVVLSRFAGDPANSDMFEMPEWESQEWAPVSKLRPSFRSADYVTKVWDAIDAAGLDKFSMNDYKDQATIALVGQPIGIRLNAFRKEASLASAEEILATPLGEGLEVHKLDETQIKAIPWPTKDMRLDQTHFMARSLVPALSQEWTPRRYYMALAFITAVAKNASDLGQFVEPVKTIFQQAVPEFAKLSGGDHAKALKLAVPAFLDKNLKELMVMQIKQTK